MRERRSLLAWHVVAAMTVVVAVSNAGAKDVPFLGGRVNDLAGLLRPDTEARLDARLRGLEGATGAQVAVLTIDSLDGDSLEEFAHRVATTWGLGQSGADTGALLLVARDDRAMRIEVGYGLEATVPDAKSRRILDELLRPRFRTGDFDGGIAAGVEALAGLIEGDPAALPARPASSPTPKIDRIMALIEFAIPLAIVSFIAAATRSAFGWLVWLFLAPSWVGVTYLAFGGVAAGIVLAACVVLFPVVRVLLQRTGAGGRLLDAFATSMAAETWTSSGGWRHGSGRGFSGRGSSGRGFSGRGGSFGGGGASSRW